MKDDKALMKWSGIMVLEVVLFYILISNLLKSNPNWSDKKREIQIKRKSSYFSICSSASLAFGPGFTASPFAETLMSHLT